MEHIDYCLDLVEQFVLIENLEFKNKKSVVKLRKLILGIIQRMEVISDVYPELGVIWGGKNLSEALMLLDSAKGAKRIGKYAAFLDTKSLAVACSRAVIPIIGATCKRG